MAIGDWTEKVAADFVTYAPASAGPLQHYRTIIEPLPLCQTSTAPAAGSAKLRVFNQVALRAPRGLERLHESVNKNDWEWKYDFARGLAVNLAPIRVNTVCPGLGLNERLACSPELVRKQTERHLIRCRAEVAEVAQTYLYLMRGSVSALGVR
jgi:hypothetical protein